MLQFHGLSDALKLYTMNPKKWLRDDHDSTSNGFLRK